MNVSLPKSFGVGARALRKEDPALLKGEGRFTADDIPTGTLCMKVLRSPLAHARFKLSNDRLTLCVAAAGLQSGRSSF